MTDVLAPHRASVREDGSSARLAIDTIRTLAMDAVQKANSGHPGTPMALAPVAPWSSDRAPGRPRFSKGG